MKKSKLIAIILQVCLLSLVLSANIDTKKYDELMQQSLKTEVTTRHDPYEMPEPIEDEQEEELASSRRLRRGGRSSSKSGKKDGTSSVFSLYKKKSSNADGNKK